MSTFLLFAAFGTGLAAYSWFVLPHPYFALVSREADVSRITLAPPPASGRVGRLLMLVACVLKALKMRQPAIDLPEPYARRMERSFQGPVRALIDRRSLGDYYIGIPAYFDALVRTDKTLLVFRSRIGLVFFPVRLLLDHVISPILVYVSVLLYMAGLGAFLLLARMLPGMSGFRRPEPADPRLAYFRESVAYFNSKQPPWEPGFLLFKLLEGQQFRRALAHCGFNHPVCEFGIENAVTSTNHLKGVDYIDIGCEAIENTPILGEIRYERLVNCYIESNPFPEGAFKTVFLVHVVDHIPDLKKVFSELHRIMAPGANVYFSGFSNYLKGSYLEQGIYQGNIFNNCGPDWYADLMRTCGFQVDYSAHMQAGWAFRLWRFTVMFHHRTEAWNVLSRLYHASGMVRAAYDHVIENLILPLFMQDDDSVSRAGRGLNFMIVASKAKA